MNEQISIKNFLKIVPNNINNSKKIYVKITDKDYININKQRYLNFKNNGIKCTCCGIEGQYFKLEQDKKSLTKYVILYGIKDGEEIPISSITSKAINPKYKKGTVLCKDCMEIYISHNKSKGIKNRKQEWKNYKNKML